MNCLSASPSSSPVDLAIRRFRLAATKAQQAHGLTTSTALEELSTRAFETETTRISSELEQMRTKAASSFLPALYMRVRDPAADGVIRLMRSACKAFELDLRFKEIEKLDAMHAQLWTLLSAGGRTSVTLEAYEQVLQDFNVWAAERYGSPPPPPMKEFWAFSESETEDNLNGPADRATNCVASPLREQPSTAAAIPKEQMLFPPTSPSIASGAVTDVHDVTKTSEGRSSTWEVIYRYLKAPSEEERRLREEGAALPFSPSASRSGDLLEYALRLVEKGPALGHALFLYSAPPPRPNMELFLSCPRNAERAVEIVAIFQSFAKQVSLVKCEAELIMWDSNNDGRLSEDEVENYVRDLTPRIAALRTIRSDMLPFYCCTVSRRLFWDLDPGNRGSLRIHSLLRSRIMDEWVNLQLMTEDDLQNWFGVLVTQQLYNKFVLLDTRNKGTLNVENLRAYKKGLPTVLDDGLPLSTSPLCSLFIDRYFETNSLMSRSELDYRKFVDFAIAVELLPQCSRPHFFWNILDVEGTGMLTPMIVNQFFRETHTKLTAAGLEVPSREVVVQEVFDLIDKAEPLRITREEFVRSPQAGLFVALLIDCLSFWSYENREQR